jgi:hypothetical protein
MLAKKWEKPYSEVCGYVNARMSILLHSPPAPTAPLHQLAHDTHHLDFTTISSEALLPVI